MSYMDRRREARYLVDFECTAGDNKVTMKVNDISINGIGIIGKAMFYQLMAIDIEVVVSKMLRIKLRGVIRYCIHDDDNSRYGLEIFDTPTKWIKLVTKYEKRNAECIYE